jgi:hypothetical protein
VLNGDVRKLETREEHKPKQVKGGCSLLQISETLAKKDDIASTGRITHLPDGNSRAVIRRRARPQSP